MQLQVASLRAPVAVTACMRAACTACHASSRSSSCRCPLALLAAAHHRGLQELVRGRLVAALGVSTTWRWACCMRMLEGVSGFGPSSAALGSGSSCSGFRAAPLGLALSGASDWGDALQNAAAEVCAVAQE